MTTFDLTMQEISKIEGKAGLDVKVEDGKVVSCHFAITEYKRFYTQAIRGADVFGLPQLTARICGTCSNAHLLCTIKAVEHALNIVPSQQTQRLRELVNYGLNIRDHALHLYVFCLPDLLGIDNILDLDENDSFQRQILEDTFKVKACGNDISTVIGGRSVHAPKPMVGGFMSLPDPVEIPRLIKSLDDVVDSVLRLIQLFLTKSLKLERDVKFAAFLDDSFTFLQGEIVTSDGLHIPEEQFYDHLTKVEIPYSHATGYTFDNSVYMTGALARINIGKERLHPFVLQEAKEALEVFPSHNIFHNNLAQAIEILHCIAKAKDILTTLHLVPEKPIPINRQKSIGKAVIEAPRGALYYRLSVTDAGTIESADIVVPSGQNQIGIEQSIQTFVQANVEQEKSYLETEIEKIVRAYDPCMSCASHFLKVRWL